MNKITSIDKIFDVICGNSIAVAMFFSVFICSCHNVLRQELQAVQLPEQSLHQAMEQPTGAVPNQSDAR